MSTCSFRKLVVLKRTCGLQIHENGAASNGHSRAHSQFVGGRQLIDRTEYVRVLQQSLHRLGYPQAAQSLQSESVSSDLRTLPCLACCGSCSTIRYMGNAKESLL